MSDKRVGRFRQFHLSTAVAVMLVLAAAVHLNLQMRIVHARPGNTMFVKGWPIEAVIYLDVTQSDAVNWAGGDNFHRSPIPKIDFHIEDYDSLDLDEAPTYLPVRIVADAAIVLCVSLSVLVLCEYVTRRRERRGQ